MKTRNNWLAWKTMRKNQPNNDDTTEFINLLNDNERPATGNTEAIEPDSKRIRIESRALMMRSLDSESKQVAHDVNDESSDINNETKITCRKYSSGNGYCRWGANCQYSHEGSKRLSVTMMIDSGASHILVRQEHAYILNNITVSEPNAECQSTDASS